MHSLLSGLSAAVIVCAAITAASAQEPVKDHLLFDFEGKKGQWVSVNDDVMGGVSRGGGRTTAEGTLDFSGVLSLENNGGFSSIRAVLEPGALSGHEGLVLRTRGDGRAYYVNLHMESRVTAGSWRAPLSTPKGTWKDVRLPFSEFGWTVFGRRLPSSSLDPSQARSLGFTIADKTDGPFQLQVDWIKAYGAAEREPDLLERAAGVEDLSIFAQAVDSAGLENAIRGPGPLTVFAPTDSAFGKLPKETLADLLRSENRVRLRAVLLNHLAPGRLVLGKRQIRTLLGTPVFVSAEGPHRLGETEVITADLEAANGLLHVIDAVLVPLGEQPGTNDEVAELIDNAISLGVPLYNGGNAEVCAAIYEVAAVSAMDAKAPGLSRDLRDTLRSSIDEAARQVDKQVAAWTLRRALDTARQAVR